MGIFVHRAAVVFKHVGTAGGERPAGLSEQPEEERRKLASGDDTTRSEGVVADTFGDAPPGDAVNVVGVNTASRVGEPALGRLVLGTCRRQVENESCGRLVHRRRCRPGRRRRWLLRSRPPTHDARTGWTSSASELSVLPVSSQGSRWWLTPARDAWVGSRAATSE